MRRWIILACLVVIAAVLMLMTRQSKEPHAVSVERKHVVLVGASIGRLWRLEEWPARTGETSFTLESVAAWQFDKSAALDEVLMRPKRKFHPTRTYLRSLFQPPPKRPGAVILKECSSYFPGGVDGYMTSISEWVHRLREARIRPILATVAPVTQARSKRDAGKQTALLAFNRRLRAYAEQEGIPLLDLEAVLRDEGGGSFLRDEFTSGDGSHLNATAYAHLDRELRTLLCEFYTCKGKGENTTCLKQQ